MKTVGIIGGVGPETTAKIYMQIVDFFRKKRKRYPSILIHNMPFSFKLEYEAAIKGQNLKKMLPYLIQSARILEKSGATYGILPCNTLHKYIKNIRQSVRIPFLSIVEETVLVVKNNNIKKVLILGTKSTIKEALYGRAFGVAGVSFIYPDSKSQKIIEAYINVLLKGDSGERYQSRIQKICFQHEQKGVDAILLACTDLHVIKKYLISRVPLLDTSEILFEAAIKKLT